MIKSRILCICRHSLFAIAEQTIKLKSRAAKRTDEKYQKLCECTLSALECHLPSQISHKHDLDSAVGISNMLIFNAGRHARFMFYVHILHVLRIRCVAIPCVNERIGAWI